MKVHHIRIVTPLFLKLKKIQHAGGTPNQNASSLSKYRLSDGLHGYTYTCLELGVGWGEATGAERAPAGVL